MILFRLSTLDNNPAGHIFCASTTRVSKLAGGHVSELTVERFIPRLAKKFDSNIDSTKESYAYAMSKYLYNQFGYSITACGHHGTCFYFLAEPVKPNEIKFLTSTRVEKRQKKYCRFKKMGIRYIDYKDGEFLKKFLNEQGRMLPRRITGNSLKYQRKVAQAIKTARQMALLPYVTDLLK